MKENKTNIMKWSRNGLSLLLAAGMVACATETTDTAVESEFVEEDTALEVDADVGADSWDNNKFNTTFASNNFYEEWDTNDDNVLDQNEYNAGFYDTWDVNDDNRLDETEWATASNDFGLENQTWSDWDTTGDGILDENEFGTGFANNNWFGGWDADRNSMLEEREYTDGLFGQWDRNRDSMLDANEYGAYNTYFGD